MLGQQVYCRLRDGRSLRLDALARRKIATTILARRGFDLLGFLVKNTHLRLGIGGDEGQELARRIEIALANLLGDTARFEPARTTAIDGQWHLDSSVRQLLRQAGGDHDDPLAEGSNLPDLLGLRLLGLHTCAAMRRALPRVDRQDLLGCLGLDRLEPANGPLEALPDAAAAALALPDLRARSAPAIAGRRAVIEIAADRLTSPQIGKLLGLHRATVAALRREPAAPELVRAVQLQLGLRHARTRQRLGPGVTLTR